MTAGVVADLLAAAVWEVQNVGAAAPESRKLTLAQMRAIAQVRTARVSTHSERAKVGTTAGWVVAAADNLGKLATIPASQTASTLVIPLSGFNVGDIITQFAINGSIQSAGNTGTLLADLRMLTAAAAGATDSSLGVMAAALSVVTDTIVSIANATKILAAAHTVLAGESFYVLITATTDAAVTEEIQSVSLIVTEN